MKTYVLRLWLPDRAGVLGQVATQIGSAGAEIIGIDILERGGGQAVDELAVEVDDAGRIPGLVRAVRSVDGVDVEQVSAIEGGVHDPRSDALDVAALLVGSTSRGELLEGLAEHGRRLLGGTWLAIVELDGGDVVADDGRRPSTVWMSSTARSISDVPTAEWLSAYVTGSRSSDRVASGEAGPDDVVWAPLPASGLAVVVGRDRVPFRARERRQVASLARIVDRRLCEFCRQAHPSVG